jgi:hypothetical protein
LQSEKNKSTALSAEVLKLKQKLAAAEQDRTSANRKIVEDNDRLAEQLAQTEKLLKEKEVQYNAKERELRIEREVSMSRTVRIGKLNVEAKTHAQELQQLREKYTALRESVQRSWDVARADVPGVEHGK